jgi:5-methylcytosine-specific restriction endonuclease McrA
MSKKGYRQTKEHKLKISRANKGKPKSLIARKNMSIAKKRAGIKPPSNLGKKFSKEHKKKIGKALMGNKNSKGRVHSLEWKRKISKMSKGENGSNWQGGKTKLQTIIRECLKYRLWRNCVFEQDGFTCQYCEDRGCYLEAHHLKKFSDIINEHKIRSIESAEKCKELWDIDNGLSLCRNCHNKTKQKGVPIWKK